MCSKILKISEIHTESGGSAQQVLAGQMLSLSSRASIFAVF